MKSDREDEAVRGVLRSFSEGERDSLSVAMNARPGEFSAAGNAIIGAGEKGTDRAALPYRYGAARTITFAVILGVLTALVLCLYAIKMLELHQLLQSMHSATAPWARSLTSGGTVTTTLIAAGGLLLAGVTFTIWESLQQREPSPTLSVGEGALFCAATLIVIWCGVSFLSPLVYMVNIVSG